MSQQVTPEQAIEIGLQHHRAGNLREAEAIYRQVLAAHEEHPAALHWLGVIARQTGHLDDELTLVSRSVELNPNDPLSRQDLGEALAVRGRFAEAEEQYLAAVALQPDSAGIINDLAVVYHKQRHYAQALATCDRALALNPDLPQAHTNRGMALTDLGRIPEALQALNHSLRVRPDHPATLLSKARALFLWGDLVPAFELYELRFKQGEIPYPKLKQPLWDGQADVRGKTVLVVSEQGAGDTIQFARYAPMLARQRGAEVILICVPEVKELLQTIGGVRILGSGEGRPTFDFHVPILSLPRIFRTTLQTIPGHVPYLSADPARVETWRQRLADEKRMKVGLVWAGSAVHKSDRNRSLPLATLAPLAHCGDIAWFSLQKGPPAAQLADAPAGMQIVDLAPDLNDYADTAAAVAALDLVITVDTSVAHVAGALARPVWMLLSYEGEWRWIRGRDDTPWYPTMRLFRQPTPGDWATPIGEIARRIREGQAGGAAVTNFETCLAAWKLLHAGKLDEARTRFEEVLAGDANYAAALHGAGWIAYLQGRRRNAGELIARALQADPKRTEAHVHLAMVQRDAGQLGAAVDSMRRAIKLDAKNGDYHAVLAALLGEQGQAAQSIEAYRQAAALNPADVAAWVNMAQELVNLNRLPEAETAARAAIAAAPTFSTTHLSLGMVLDRQRRSAEAEDALQRALALNPEEADAHMILSFSLLRRGEFVRGWREYEWRFRGQADPVDRVPCTTPQWDGSPLAGRTLLIHAEQGFGDSIQFVRFLTRLSGGRVIFRCAPALVDLMRTLPGGIEVFSQDDPMPAHDVHLPLLSLGVTLPINPQAIAAAAVPYLFADPQRAAAWSAKLPPPSPGHRRVGICWSGNPKQIDNRHRSIGPQLLARLAAVPGITWISLQMPRRLPPPMPMLDLTDELRSFADTAALMQSLDLILTVDTSVAHLAGALGRPAWVLLHTSPAWQWDQSGSSSKWYPSVRLLRQPAPGDWEPVIAQVAAELRALP